MSRPEIIATEFTPDNASGGYRCRLSVRDGADGILIDGYGRDQNIAHKDASANYDQRYPEPKKAPRVTEEQMDDRIVSVHYSVHFGKLTHCIITLDNGYIVTGESSCVCPENFDQKKGETIAHTNAREKLWPLFGFLLAEDLHRKKMETTNAK